MENQKFEPSFDGNTADNSSDSLKNRLQKGAAILAAFTALASEACSPDRGNDGGQAGGRSKSVEVQGERMKPNSVLLAEYRKNIHLGNFPSEGQKERTLARALEIIILKGMSVDKGSRVEVEARGTVPVQIKIDGQFVPVGHDDYTAEELDLVRLVQGISASMGNTPDKNNGGSLESEERISPMAEKVFKRTKNSEPGAGREIHTSPDLEDFLGDDNKPEKRKSKSEF